MQELEPAKGSSTERIGSTLMDIFVFIDSVMICFTIIAKVVIKSTSCTEPNCLTAGLH
uniref:Uncharacterized protein n=1 Tax=Arundo donax TaxID=35708 RepID=A0A0A8YUR3_ARUDO